MITSFNRLLISPLSSDLSNDGMSLKPSILPYFENIDSSFKLKIDGNDNASFVRIGEKDKFIYKLKIIEMKFLCYKIRFADNVGKFV